jgi:hypothetical protein
MVLVCLLLVFSCGGCDREGKENQLKTELAKLKSVLVPLRFRIVERKYGVIKGEIIFYSLVMDDADDLKNDIEDKLREIQPLGSQEFMLSGEELNIDFLGYRVKDTHLPPDIDWVFPYRIFSDKLPPEEGIPIYRYYDQNGFPGIYNKITDGLNDDAGKYAKDNVVQVFAEIKLYSEKSEDRITGNALHDINSGNMRFKVGAWYDIMIHAKKGTGEFIEEKESI